MTLSAYALAATFGHEQVPCQVPCRVNDYVYNIDTPHEGRLRAAWLRNTATLLCLIGAIGIIIGGTMKGGFFYKGFYNEGIIQALKSPQFYIPVGGAILFSVAAGICRLYTFRKCDTSQIKRINPLSSKIVQFHRLRGIFEIAGLGSLFAPGDIFVSGLRFYRSFKHENKVGN